MADNHKWFKLWVSALLDGKLANLDNATFGQWAKFGAYIKAHGEGGKIIIEPPARELQFILQVGTFDTIIEAIKLFPNCMVERNENRNGGFTVTLSKWKKYQEDYTVTERQKRFRERNRNDVRGEEKRREEKRGESEEKRSKKEKVAVEIPDWIPTENWQAYIEMRKAIKKPMTEHAVKLAISTLNKLREDGHAAGDVLDQSVMNSYQGLFALKSDSKLRVGGVKNYGVEAGGKL